METQLIFSFITASVLLTLMPGPDNIFVITESITKGARNGIAISTGLVSGIMVHTLAASTGLSILIQQSALAFQILKYLGAAYLFYLAFRAFKEKRLPVNYEDKIEAPTFNFLKLMRKGFLMNVLNPKVSLFFIAFLPQFINKDGFNIKLQMIILGLLFMVQAILIFIAISMLAGRLRNYLNSPRFWHFSKWGKVAVLSVLGCMLFFSKK